MTHLELFFIINKKAGSGNGEQAADVVLKWLTEHNIPYQAKVTNYQGHAIELTQQLKQTHLKPWSDSDTTKKFPLLVVIGGDGTLHEVVNALGDETDIPVGYIPSGSGNDFARGVHLTRDPIKALQQILSVKQPQPFTVIHYLEQIKQEEGLFTNNLGIGLDANIVATANASKSKKKLNRYHLGALSYLLAAMHVMFKQKGFPILVEVNGETKSFNQAYLCTTTNHPYFGGGLAIAPQASPKEACMELIIVERINLFKIIHLAFLLLRQKHLNSKHVHHYKSSQIRIVSTTPQFGQADGEVISPRAFDISFSIRKRLFWL